MEFVASVRNQSLANILYDAVMPVMNTSVRNLRLANIPYGAVMPVMNREDEVTYMDVPFGEQVYLQDNLNSAGRPRRVYALQTVKGLRQTNPFTRRPFAAGNIKRVKRNNRR